MSKHIQLEKIVHGAWKQRIEGEAEQPWLASMRMRYGEPLLARFHQNYQALCRLPRRTRRRLQRRLAMSLATAALLLALSGTPVSLTVNASAVSGDTQIAQVQTGRRGAELGPFSIQSQDKVVRSAVQPKGPAATIVVNGNNPGTDCTLDDAIIAANTDTATGNCTAGSGDDILDIQVNVNLTAPAPVISSTMTLEGNGNTIAGDDTFGPLLSVNATGDMTLNDATITGGHNVGSGYGGGLYVSGGTAEVNNSFVTGNYSNVDGGGISAKDGATLTINNSEISYNGAPNYNGGGVANRNATTTISGSVLVGNNAKWGGAINNYLFGNLFLNDSTVTGNDSNREAGGIVSDRSYLRVDNSTISNNTSILYGGGIDCLRGCNLVMNNSTVSGNSNSGSGAGASAGLYVGWTLPATATINDSTITGNSVYGPGAGLYVGNLGNVTLSRSIIAGNTNLADGQASEVVNLNTITVDDYNLIGHAGLTTAQAISGLTPGPSNILATSDGTLPTLLTDILYTLLQNNGGSTDTHALPLGSPAVDGVASGCAAGMEDQRHLPRAGGPGMGGPFCDIGAFEVQNPNTRVFMPAVLNADTAQNNTQAAQPESNSASFVMSLLLGLVTISPLGFLKNTLSRKANKA